MSTITLNLNSGEAEELLIGLKLRHFQDRTDKALIEELAKKVEAAATPAFRWTPGIWERMKTSNPIRVTIKPRVQ